MGMRKMLVHCDDCNGDCCTGMILQIPTPHTEKDYEDMRWYLYHEKTHIYIDRDGDWVAEMDLPCCHRDAKGRCRIYEKRPPVCREAKIRECHMNLEDARIRFRTVADYDAWLENGRSEEAEKKGRS